jgi:hypothetical protein
MLCSVETWVWVQWLAVNLHAGLASWHATLAGGSECCCLGLVTYVVVSLRCSGIMSHVSVDAAAMSAACLLCCLEACALLPIGAAGA